MEPLDVIQGFGPRLGQMRRELGLSQRVFGAELRATVWTISRLERGVDQPSRRILNALARRYPRSIGWLLTGMTDTPYSRWAHLLDRISPKHQSILDDTAQLLMRADEMSISVLESIVRNGLHQCDLFDKYCGLPAREASESPLIPPPQ